MELNFNKNMIVSSDLKRIFWEQTTPVDQYPSFSNLSCVLANQEEFINALCVAKIDAIMKEDNCNVIKALIKLMKIYDIAKISEFKLVMAKNSPNKYLPIKCTIVLKNMCLKGESLACQFKNVSVNVAKHDKCLANTYFNEALYKDDWYPVSACITGCVWKNVNVDDNLWHVRAELIRDYNNYITCKNLNMPLPPDNNAIFVILSPKDTLGTTSWKSEGANDIEVVGFGTTFEESEHIYNDLLCNKLAIIRQDFIEHPTAKNELVRVFTCCYVNIVKVNREIPNGHADKLCEVPLKDCMILHMGEIKLLSDIELSWGYGIKVNKVYTEPAEVNPFTDVKVKIDLSEVYGAILNYDATFIEKNMDNLSVDTNREETFNIPNSGCGCRF